MNATNYQKHSIPFYISPRLFRNKRLQQRRCKWAARLKKAQLSAYAQIVSTVKTDRYRRQQQQQHQHNNNRHRWKSLQADVTIDLLSDDSDNDEDNGSNPVTSMSIQATPTVLHRNEQPAMLPSGSLFAHPSGSFQLSMVPNITLVPVQALQQQSKQNVPVQLSPADSSSNAASESAKHKRKSHRPRKRFAPKANSGVTSTLSNINSNGDDDCIVLTDDDDVDDSIGVDTKYVNKTRRENYIKTLPLLVPRQPTSPPPLAPLSQYNLASETVEEVTVSLVPRTATTANCARQKQQQLLQKIPSSSSSLRHGDHQHMTSNGDSSVYGNDNGSDDTFPMLPDETTVHTVIANRIYELSLSKLREGLASSGMPEFANETSPSQKLSPTQRQRKIIPHAATPPPAPISLKLSSDLSISLISDDEGDPGIGAIGYGDRAAVGAASVNAADEAHAAVKLLQQQHPQLSVVQHLQYHPDMVAAALATAASRANAAHAGPVSAATPTPRRRKLG